MADPTMSVFIKHKWSQTGKDVRGKLHLMVQKLVEPTLSFVQLLSTSLEYLWRTSGFSLQCRFSSLRVADVCFCSALWRAHDRSGLWRPIATALFFLRQLFCCAPAAVWDHCSVACWLSLDRWSHIWLKDTLVCRGVYGRLIVCKLPRFCGFKQTQIITLSPPYLITVCHGAVQYG